MTFTSEEKKAEFNEVLESPDMDSWQRAIMSLAYEWATRMETSGLPVHEIAQGELDKCESTAKESGRMVQGAKGLLCDVWIHGETLSNVRIL